MLADFESRFADLLGSALPAPLTGRVDVAPGPVAGPDSAIIVAITEARRLQPEFGSTRPEVAPGADDPRRIVRLDCDIEVAVRVGAGDGRPETIEALDTVLYELDSARFRAAPTLDSPSDDPGFVLERFEVRSALTAPVEGLPRISLGAVGWFWPPDTPGIIGEPIAEARVRTVARPVVVSPWPLRLRAGDPTVTLTLTMGTVGTTVLDGDRVGSDDFGELALRVIDDGGRPGAGQLAGGADGPSASRIVALDQGTTAIEYTPPNEASTDHLVIAVARPDTGDGLAIGIELARFSLVVTA